MVVSIKTTVAGDDDVVLVRRKGVLKVERKVTGCSLVNVGNVVSTVEVVRVSARKRTERTDHTVFHALLVVTTEVYEMVCVLLRA